MAVEAPVAALSGAGRSLACTAVMRVGCCTAVGGANGMHRSAAGLQCTAVCCDAEKSVRGTVFTVVVEAICIVGIVTCIVYSTSEM